MDKVPDIISEKIFKFSEYLEKSNIHINELYLFGSYANGTYNEWSDIDLAVISDDFVGTRFIDYSKFVDAIMNVDRAIEPIAFLTSDFNSNDFFVQEIKTKGIKYI